MKKRVLSLLILCCFSIIEATKWVHKGKPSKICIQAGKILGIEIPKDLKEAQKILDRYHIKDWSKLREITSVFDLENNVISAEKLQLFLEYNDKTTKRSTVHIEDITVTTMVIFTVPESDQNTTIYLAKLLAPYIALKNIAVLMGFAKNKDAKKLMQEVLYEKFPDYKEKIKFRIAPNPTQTAESCARELQNLCIKNKKSGNYITVTHWPIFDNAVKKNFTAFDHKGSVLQPLTWQQQEELYNNGLQGCAKALLHQIAASFFDELRWREAEIDLANDLKDFISKDSDSSEQTGDSSSSKEE